MTSKSWRHSLRHLGSLHGEGRLLARGQDLGPVRYEIDGYKGHRGESGNGRIEGERAMLIEAFEAQAAEIVLADGQSTQIIVSEPGREPAAEFRLIGPLPKFG